MNNRKEETEITSAQSFMQLMFAIDGRRELKPTTKNLRIMSELGIQARDYLLMVGGGDIISGLRIVEQELTKNDPSHSHLTSKNKLGVYLHDLSIDLPPYRVSEIEKIITE